MGSELALPPLRRDQSDSVVSARIAGRCLTALATIASLAAHAAPATRLATPADIQAAAVAVGFSVKGGRVVDSCGEPTDPPRREDLNGDGRNELIFGDGMCMGGSAGWFGIATKVASGKWTGILATQGVYQTLKTRRSGWPDIQVELPGCSGSDPRYSFRNGKYVVSGSRPQHCTSGPYMPHELKP